MPETPLPAARDPANDDADLFRQLVADAVPLSGPQRVHRRPPPPAPVPVQTEREQLQVLDDSLHDGGDFLDIETGEELSFLRPGMGRMVLRKLRRGHWVVQDQLDLHGMRSEEARHALAAFLHRCTRRGVGCVRIIHGKGLGSPNREPVLKRKLRRWLVQRDEVLAFCQAPPADGGAGAALVLLKRSLPRLG